MPAKRNMPRSGPRRRPQGEERRKRIARRIREEKLAEGQRVRRESLTQEERARRAKLAQEQRLRRARKEENIRREREAAAKRVSYIRKPLAGRSVIGAFLLLAALLFLGFCVYTAYATRGGAAFSVGGPALCSILCAFSAFWYHVAAFREKDKNYRLARIGIVLSAVLLAFWGALIYFSW